MNGAAAQLVPVPLGLGFEENPVLLEFQKIQVCRILGDKPVKKLRELVFISYISCMVMKSLQCAWGAPLARSQPHALLLDCSSPSQNSLIQIIHADSRQPGSSDREHCAHRNEVVDVAE